MDRTVLFVTQSISFGGAAKMLCFIAESLSSLGYVVHIANIKTTNTKGAESYERTISPKIVIHDISAKYGEGSFLKRRASRIRNIIGLYKVAKEIHADTLISFTIIPNVISVIVGKILRIPVIISERGDPKKTFSSGLADKIRLKMINRAEGAVFQTPGAQEYYGKTLQERSTIIANPIFINEAIPPVFYENMPKTVVSLGRLENHQKRYDVLIDGFALFSKTHQDYRLVLYGVGPDEGKIREWCRQKNISEKTDFMGLTETPLWCDKNVMGTPFEMVGYIKKAKYVITDTFHGTVFSMKYQKQFVTFIRDSNRNKLLDLLQRFSLEKRSVDSISELPRILLQQYDIEGLIKRIEEEKNKSFLYLENAIKGDFSLSN